MKFERKEVEVVRSPLALRTKRFATGALGKPADVLATFGDALFTGASNGVGSVHDGKVTVYNRTEGKRPCRLAEGNGPGLGAAWYTDPDGDSIGKVSADGEFVSAMKADGGPASIGADPYRPLFASSNGSTIYLVGSEGMKRISCPHPRIDAVSWGQFEMIWYVSGSVLQSITYTGVSGRKVDLPSGTRIDTLVRNRNDILEHPVYYCDTRRDVIGRILDERVIEYQLPAGTGPRALTIGLHSNPWFTGRGGQSLFQFEYHKRAIEYVCSTPGSDLTRVSAFNDDMWFTEPAADSISSASVAGF